MKIVEFDKDGSGQRIERMKILEFDVGKELKPLRSHSVSDVAPDERIPAPARLSSGLKMHVLDLGKLRLDKNLIVAHSTVATAREPNPPGKLIDIPMAAYLIEHPDGNVLYDTGCHPDWSGPNGRWPARLQEIFPVISGDECMLPNRLDALGIGPNQIRHVVLSHLHCDHAGCVEYFRKSQIIVHEDEFSSAFAHAALHDQSTAYAPKDLDTWSKLDLRWRLIGRTEPDQTVVEGVRLLNFGSGHAYGMLGLSVKLRSEAGVLLVSDACYTAENFGPPVRQPGLNVDTMGFARTIQRIKALANDTQARVWFGHDADQFSQVRKSSEGWYE
jgi:glyoxylase-like metal-dependent hydrolase (beta-lactamase superfamily II)